MNVELNNDTGATRIVGHDHWLPPTLGPDGLPANDESSCYWFRSQDGTFQRFPASHTRRSWTDGPAAESYARAAHLPED